MASTVSICNLALGHLGADKIDALSEASSEARACKAVAEAIPETLFIHRNGKELASDRYVNGHRSKRQRLRGL